MSKAKDAMKVALKIHKEARKDAKRYEREHAEHFIEIAKGLEVIGDNLINLKICQAASVDLSVTGDHHVLNGTFRALRKMGYEPSTRPTEEKVTGYNSWFYKTGWPAIWFAFSSTKCTRKKIGTKMVEQPVYEVVCE